MGEYKQTGLSAGEKNANFFEREKQQGNQVNRCKESSFYIKETESFKQLFFKTASDDFFGQKNIMICEHLVHW